MDCCGLCADDDRDVWMTDRISPKIGLSDSDLLDFHSDDEMPVAPAAQCHRSQPSRQTSRVAASLPQKSERSPETRSQTSLNRLRSGGQFPPTRTSFDERQGTTPLELQSTSAKPPYRAPSLARAASKRREPSPPARVATRSKAFDGDGSVPPPMSPAKSLSANDRVPTKLSELTPEEKEEEKKRLQALVKEFAKEAVAGFSIERIDNDTGVRAKTTFSMDRFLTTIDLRNDDDDSSLPHMSLPMEDLTGIFKGDDAVSHSSITGDCDLNRVLVLTSSDNPDVVLEAASRQHRDKVYTCLKILRLSFDIARKDKRQ
ncbi:hypothetical protein TGARI_283510 [Toxoplasma gondii ARI]|uniref:IMC-associated protein 1 n=1 Tax=Toxoplasma gondii ARI TaxID=1074872 RepID=A0A139XJS1_TOXGO|nr:hypothetical protein TGARI_283510 [Toxoplasma gondii ARI]